MSLLRIAITLSLTGVVSCAAAPEPASSSLPSGEMNAQAAERGRSLTMSACASCHAIDGAGSSPMPEAPTFRSIVQHHPIDALEEAFGEGLVTSHPAMPPYIFRASEIDDLIAYLETLKAER